ncbi:MAG: valine--tRNA ligase [Clostridiales bacterium]|nr:valine--tRNA ligase [Clostridiales bacterium]MCF8022271.1 valine--tRNA ligase [Clostridiales bacterium]
MAKKYDPEKVESKWYSHWEKNKYFHSEVDPEKDPFSIVMPPPNVTGELHMGHALDSTLQDILTRFRRMQGYNALWLPGTDHAGIATQTRVEGNMAREGVTKHDLGREKFLERVWDWKNNYGGRITNQLRCLGASCDWDRERFTMDDGCYNAVIEVFVRLYQQGLIYRDYYITNWCSKCQTTISDIEVEHMDKPGHLYYVKYPVKGQEDHLSIATTRPETMLGDVAVAVHPDDERYSHLIGKTLILPLVEKEIPVISDEYVAPEFGTGAVKVTPAHDPNDFEMGKRHDLPEIIVINKNAQMTGEAGPRYEGMDRWECRKQVVKDLENNNYLIRIEDHTHAVGHCYRCGSVIEPMLSKQWFVRMQPLAGPAIQAVEEGRIKFIPERFARIYLNWMRNLRDWCISRQLWWGHRIPVWYCSDCGEMTVSRCPIEKCEACGSSNIEQDTDVLDTWFSSALWPFSTLGWPEKTMDLAYYYPTSVLVTGRDIIFFWVARMIFSGLAHMNEVPFKKVFIHGLVLDSQGRKMSKSLGNGVDPIQVIESHGADSLRFMLITGNTPGNDLRFHFERLEGARNFANKIWNASRFALLNLQDYDPAFVPGSEDYALSDKWILSRYQSVIEEVTNGMENYELGESARSLYEYMWNEICDWYIELVKPRLYGKTTIQDKETAQYVLVSVLRGTLELLHPFMPFITEEIWQYLPHKGESIMLSSWPGSNEQLKNKDAEEKMNTIMDVTRGIRQIRSEMNVEPGKMAQAWIVSSFPEKRQAAEEGREYIENLASASLNIYSELEDTPEQAATAVASGVGIYVPLKGLIDVEREKARLEKELAAAEKDLIKIQSKLNNAGFLNKAPGDVVEKEKSKEVEISGKVQTLKERFAMFGDN